MQNISINICEAHGLLILVNSGFIPVQRHRLAELGAHQGALPAVPQLVPAEQTSAWTVIL
jgi:hypothetical protein